MLCRLVLDAVVFVGFGGFSGVSEFCLLCWLGGVDFVVIAVVTWV